MTTCMMTSPPFRCTLPVGHDGPHATRDGYGWHDSDDMDGGVTAALIEKEAEEPPSVDYEAMWWDAERRAEKAEKERDRWHSMWRQRGIKHLAAKKRATRAEARADIRGRAVAIYQQRAREAEAERDEWRQTALDERGAALDTLEQIKARDARIKAVQDLIDQADTAGDWTATCTRLQSAIDNPNPYEETP